MDLSGVTCKVYDGNSVWDPILATYDGSTPNPAIDVFHGWKMLSTLAQMVLIQIQVGPLIIPPHLL